MIFHITIEIDNILQKVGVEHSLLLFYTEKKTYIAQIIKTEQKDIK